MLSAWHFIGSKKMKVETYKETYHNPVSQIPVPVDFQMGNFDVIFMKKTSEFNNNPKPKRKPNPLLQGSVTIIDDITPLDNDWELD